MFKIIRVGIGLNNQEIYMEGSPIIFQEMDEIKQLVKKPDLKKFETGDFQTITGIYLYNGKEIIHEDEWVKTRYIEDAYKIGNISSEIMLSIINSFIKN